MGKVALRVVESEFQVRDLELRTLSGSQKGYQPGSEKGGHSLHYVIPSHGALNPDVVASFIDRYTAKDEVVFDPFCSAGTTALQANLMGRIAYFSDVDPLGVKIARAKIEPADLTEVTLRVQQVNLRRPINAKLFDEIFSPFYDLNTFREIYNLRTFLQQNYDRVSRFIELAALSLLHGHSAGYFSVYTFPQLSLSPREQEEMNLKRGQTPDYRAVIPRILRKVSSILRDGLPSAMRNVSFKNRFAASDSRSIGFVPTASVDMIMTTPPRPRCFSNSDGENNRQNIVANAKSTQKELDNSGLWLQSWFAGLNRESFKQEQHLRQQLAGVESWRDFMNESLLEMARVCKPGARAVLELGIEVNGKDEIYLDQELVALVNANLARYWQPECAFVYEARGTALERAHGTKGRDVNKAQRYLVIKRR